MTDLNEVFERVKNEERTYCFACHFYHLPAEPCRGPYDSGSGV